MRELMKRLTLAAFIVVGTLTTVWAFQTEGSAIRLDYKSGETTYLHSDGIERQELVTREQDPELYCLAENIYHEARSDMEVGQAATADVVLNRVYDTRYPNTICEVVYQAVMKESWKTKQQVDLSDDQRIYYPARHRCQFSWYCDGAEDKIHYGDAWYKAQAIAYEMLYSNKWRGITQGATHYHAHYVDPVWADELQLVGSIGAHVFYRWN